MKKLKWGTWLRFSTIGLLVVLLVGLSTAQLASARSIEFTELEIEAEVMKDGSLFITEQRTASFDGNFSGMYQWINREPGVVIENISVGEAGKPYRFIPGATSYGPAGTYYVADEGQRTYIDWSYEASDETRTFVVSYHVLGQVKLHEDVAELY
jgi:uncharacterized membrane protein